MSEMRKTTDEPGEVWASHPVYAFDVSTHGRVRNLRTGRLVGYAANATAGGRNPLTGKPRPAAPRYRQVHMGTVRKYVHVLVLETFIGPRPDGYEADHIDHDGMNNHLPNLRWLPRAENQARKRNRKAAA
jgi:hypothetical protein